MYLFLNEEECANEDIALFWYRYDNCITTGLFRALRELGASSQLPQDRHHIVCFHM